MIGKKITPRKKRLEWLFCFLVACFLFSFDLSAQNYPNLVSEAQAQTMLSNEIPTLESNMNSYPQGSPAYLLAERTYFMYVHTWENIFSGRNVEESLTSAFEEFALDANGNDLDEDELPELSKNGPEYGDQVFDGLVTFLEQ